MSLVLLTQECPWLGPWIKSSDTPVSSTFISTTIAPTSVSVIIVRALKVSIWFKWWSKSTLLIPVVSINIGRGPSSPFWDQFVTILVVLHLIIQLIWIHTLSFFLFSDFFMVDRILGGVSLHNFKVFILEAAREESTNHLFVSWIGFNMEWSVIFKFDILFLVSHIKPISPVVLVDRLIPTVISTVGSTVSTCISASLYIGFTVSLCICLCIFFLFFFLCTSTSWSLKFSWKVCHHCVHLLLI